MKIAVMGAGALGGYFGGRLAEAGHEVWLIARGAHLDALKRDGLRIVSPKGDLHLPDIHATGDPAEAGPADAVLFCVKNRDVEGAANALKPLLGPESFAITVQNGVTAWERLADVIGRERVLPAVVRMPADIAEPGLIRHGAPLDMITFGEVSGQRTARVEALFEDLRAAGVTPQIHDNIIHDVWMKFCFQSVFASLTSLTRLDAGPLRDVAETRALWRTAIDEAYGVGKAVVPDLPEEVADAAWRMATEFIPDNVHASMLDDLNRKRPIELEYLSGDVVRLGARHGVPTPVHGVFYALLKPAALLLDAAADSG